MLECAVTGSRHVVPDRTTPFPLTTAVVQGGSLSGDITSQLLFNGKGQGLVLGENPAALSLALTPASGNFAGSFKAPGSVKALNLKGVILQKSARGAGFFLDAAQSGRIQLFWDPASVPERSVLGAGTVAGFALKALVDQATGDFAQLLISMPGNTQSGIPKEINLNFDITGARCSLDVAYDTGSEQNQISQSVSSLPYTFSLVGRVGKLILLATPKVLITLSFTDLDQGHFEAKYASGKTGTMSGSFTLEPAPLAMIAHDVLNTGIGYFAAGLEERDCPRSNAQASSTGLTTFCQIS